MAKEKEDPKDEFDEWYNYAKDGERDWRTQAEEDKDFYWSKQWDASDIAKLKKENCFFHLISLFHHRFYYPTHYS